MFSSSSLLVLLFHSKICLMELSHTKIQKPDLWCSLLATSCQKLNRSNCCLHSYKRTSSPTLCHHSCPLMSSRHLRSASCLQVRYASMLLWFLSNSSSLHHAIKSQIASAHLVVPTEEALQLWDVTKRHPEVPTHADYAENGKLHNAYRDTW